MRRQKASAQEIPVLGRVTWDLLVPPERLQNIAVVEGLATKAGES